MQKKKKKKKKKYTRMPTIKQYAADNKVSLKKAKEVLHEETLTEQIHKYYTDQEHGYTDIKTLADRFKVTQRFVKEVLMKTSEAYARSRQIRNIHPIHWRAYSVGEILHADLFFLKKGKDTTAHQHPVLIVIDVYSRYLWLYPLKKKSDLITEFNTIIAEIRKKYPDQYIKIVTDRGTEFSKLDELIDDENVEHIYSKSRHGAAVAEGNIVRVRRILSKLPKGEAIDFVKISKNLNTVGHQAGRPEPLQVFRGKLKGMQPEEQQVNKNEDKFKLYDIVRKADRVDLNPFAKKSDQLPFSKELYQIIEIGMYNGKYKYRIIELGGTRKEQDFYYVNELQQVDDDFLKKYIENKNVDSQNE
jgi:IS30 family transposase